MITRDHKVVARRMRGAQSVARLVVIYLNTLYEDPAYRGLSLGALRVLSAIRDADGKPLGPTGLAKLLDMPRSTAHLYAEELLNRKLVKKIGCAYVPVAEGKHHRIIFAQLHRTLSEPRHFRNLAPCA